MKDPMEITRLTTDEPKNNTETMLNYSYGKDGNAVLRYADGQEDVDLCEYISKRAKEKGCEVEPEDLMEGACMECDCELAILYTVSVQAAELRGRLKMYEDAGISLGDLKNESLTVEELKAKNLINYLLQFDSLLSEVMENLGSGEQYEFLQVISDQVSEVMEVMEEGPNA